MVAEKCSNYWNRNMAVDLLLNKKKTHKMFGIQKNKSQKSEVK